MYTMYMSGACEGQNRTLDLLGWEVKAVVSCCVDVRIQTQVLSESSQEPSLLIQDLQT